MLTVSIIASTLFCLNIVELEYFFDNDPGFGNGINVPITSANQLEENFDLDLSGIDDGFHILYVRMKNEVDNWSLTFTKRICKVTVANAPFEIIGLEYFFDNDPGFGNGTDVPFVSGESIDISFTIDLDDLEIGFHLLYVRTKNEYNDWSITHTKPIFKADNDSTATDIVSIGWYFTGIDADSSLVYSFSDFSATANIEENFSMSIAHLTQDSTYNMHLFAIDEDGNRSIEIVTVFTANFIPDVQITESDDNIELSWNEVYGADLYRIYHHDLPSGAFIEVDSTTQTNWTTAVTTNRKFYYVTAGKE